MQPGGNLILWVRCPFRVENGHEEVSSISDGNVCESCYLFTVWVIHRTELGFLYTMMRTEPMFQGFKALLMVISQDPIEKTFSLPSFLLFFYPLLSPWHGWQARGNRVSHKQKMGWLRTSLQLSAFLLPSLFFGRVITSSCFFQGFKGHTGDPGPPGLRVSRWLWADTQRGEDSTISPCCSI